MKAVACQDAKLELVDWPAPQPGPGQVVLVTASLERRRE